MIKSAFIFSIVLLITFGSQAALVSVEPDDFPEGDRIEVPGVSLSATNPLSGSVPFQ